MKLRSLTLLMASVTTLAMQQQALAQSAPAATGIAAGLGLTAASGKTTVSGGAGAIEASLLSAEAVLAAGAEIRSQTESKADAHPVFVLGAADTVDLASATWVALRIGELDGELKSIRCTPTKAAPAGTSPLAMPAATPAQGGLAPNLTDLSAALATDKTISAIALTANDRMLVNAVANPTMSRGSPPAPNAGPWVALGAVGATAPNERYLVPGEIKDVEQKGLLAKYGKLLTAANSLAACSSAPDAKAAVNDVSDFVKSVSAAPQGQAPLMIAAELSQFEGENPYVLRVAIEQIGGTAITRANIWYQLGWPGAATVSAGLLASYRLVDPQTGTVKASGLVRCMTKPANIEAVQTSFAKPAQQVCQVAPA
jgi:hypothetical protein